MENALTPYRVSPLPVTQPQIIEPPLSPRVRVFVLTLARALQMVVNGLHELAGEPKR